MAIGDLGILFNSKTGSAFTILAKKSPIVCGFRCWFQTRDDGSNMTELAFRFRVEAEQGTMVDTVFKDLLDNHFPEVKWSKVGSNYGSLLGSLQFFLTQYDAASIKNCLSQNGGLDLIWNYMMETLRPMEFPFEQEEFCDFLAGEIQTSLSQSQVKYEKDSTLLILKTPNGLSYVKDGNDITGSLMQAQQESVKPLEEVIQVSPGVSEGMETVKEDPSSDVVEEVMAYTMADVIPPAPKPKGKIMFKATPQSEPVSL